MLSAQQGDRKTGSDLIVDGKIKSCSQISSLMSLPINWRQVSPPPALVVGVKFSTQINRGNFSDKFLTTSLKRETPHESCIKHPARNPICAESQSIVWAGFSGCHFARLTGNHCDGERKRHWRKLSKSLVFLILRILSNYSKGRRKLSSKGNYF